MFEVNRSEWDEAFEAAGADPDPVLMGEVIDRLAEEAGHSVLAVRRARPSSRHRPGPGRPTRSCRNRAPVG